MKVKPAFNDISIKITISGYLLSAVLIRHAVDLKNHKDTTYI